MKPRQAVSRDRKLDLVRIDVAQRRDVVPRDQRARDLIEQTRSHATDAEAAQQSGNSDVGRDDAQRSAGVGDLEVVDAHDLASVDVDDLFVEKILDEVERLLFGEGYL